MWILDKGIQMGVLACDRNNCENVMCDRLVCNMYVCNVCASEFASKVGDVSIPSREMMELFVEFMKSEKHDYGDDRIVTVNEFLNVKNER